MKNSNIVDIITSRSAKLLSLVLSGNILAAGLGFLAVLLISRELSVSDFGLFNLAVSYMVIAARCAVLGTEVPLIKYYSSYISAGKNDEAGHVVRTILNIRVVSSLVIAGFTFSSAELISTRIFHYPELVPLMRLSSLGILSISLFSYIRNVFHAYQEFRKSVIFQLLNDLGKFLSAAVLIFMLSDLTTFKAVAIFALIPFFGLFPGLVNLRGVIFSLKRPVDNLLGQILSYGKWRFVSSVTGTILPYVGVFMLARMSSSEAVGIYGLAVNLTLIFPIIANSLVTVLLPKVSRFRAVDQFKNFMKASLKISLYIGIFIIPLLFVSNRLIPLFFGIKYLNSVPVFNWLLIGSVLQVINMTIRVVLYSRHKPEIVAVADVLSLILMFAGCYYLVPLYGTIAPAVTLVAVNGAVTLITYLYTSSHIHGGRIKFEEEDIAELS